MEKGVNQAISQITREVFQARITPDSPVVSSEDEMVTQVTRDVFETMITPDLQVDGGAGWRSEISAMIGLAGEQSGMVVIHAPGATAQFIAGSMLGDESAQFSAAELRDTMGEVANMVAGNIKAWFAEHGVNCALSVPTVISGDQFEVKVLAGGKRSTIKFMTHGHPFMVETIFVEN